MNCRHCQTHLVKTFVDLGEMPPSNSYVTIRDEKEKKYPLKVMVCHECYLVQTEDFVDREECFSKDYAYFSSMSKSFLDHAKEYVDMIIERLQLDSSSSVVEIACNDGYLLQYFLEKKIYPLGIEPTASTAKVAKSKGLSVLDEFFGTELASSLLENQGPADLIIGNNVLAHVPDINDFLIGINTLLSPQGTVTFEFPHFLNLIRYNQFDTIYHEHYSYLSLTALVNVFASNQLEVYDVEEIQTHGGSLRIYGQIKDFGKNEVSERVKDLLYKEDLCGLKNMEFYDAFQGDIEQIKRDFILFRRHCMEKGFKVAGYGAAAKANTFLNYVKANERTIPFIADVTPAKQGKFMPGSLIPIVAEDKLVEYDPDYVIIFPWNFKDEIVKRLKPMLKSSCRFVTFIPEMEILP